MGTADNRGGQGGEEMKAVIEFVKGWRAPGEPWSYYIFVPIVGIIVAAALIVALPVHYLLILAGFKEGLFE